MVLIALQVRVAISLPSLIASFVAELSHLSFGLVKPVHYNNCMPVIKRFGNCAIKMYADEHPPAHFHVEFSNGVRCSVEISTLAVIAGTVRPLRRLREPLEWAAKNRDLLQRKWEELTK
ncbi:MAG: DUF4160 domain-containing protein [Caldilineaceae bacterium]|nr:DUF4160 domain-containing protein [Caldilineaceae bacterium]